MQDNILTLIDHTEVPYIPAFLNQHVLVSMHFAELCLLVEPWSRVSEFRQWRWNCLWWRQQTESALRSSLLDDAGLGRMSAVAETHCRYCYCELRHHSPPKHHSSARPAGTPLQTPDPMSAPAPLPFSAHTTHSFYVFHKCEPCAGSGFERTDPIRFLAGCRTRRLIRLCLSSLLA